jgi:hypothetical protein
MKLVLFTPISKLGVHPTAKLRPIFRLERPWEIIAFRWGRRTSPLWQWFPLYWLRDNTCIEVGVGIGKHFVCLIFPSNGKPIGYRSFMLTINTSKP